MREKLTTDDLLFIRRRIFKPICESQQIQAWVVGGAVRDHLYNRVYCTIISDIYINDIDVVCSDKDEFVGVLSAYCRDGNVKYKITPMANGHATVFTIYSFKDFTGTSPYKDFSFDIEISQLKDTLWNDALSRDFTCNAWYLPIHNDDKIFSPLTKTTPVYPVIGKELIPCDSCKTFIDNPLRIFRAMDMISRGYRPTTRLVMDIIQAAKQIKASEELRKSMLGIVHKIFCGLIEKTRIIDDVVYAFNWMAELNLWPMVDGRIEGMVDCMHENHYHHDSVWQHTMEVLTGVMMYHVVDEKFHKVQPDVTCLWAAFLHDIGKIETVTKDDRGMTHFYGHHDSSAIIAGEILKDAPVSKQMAKDIVALIQYHMETKPFGDADIPKNQYKHIRRLMLKLGEEQFHRYLLLNHADCAASDRIRNENTNNICKAICEMKRNNEPNWFEFRLPVDGNMIKESIPNIPAKGIGLCINQLLKVTLAHPFDYETQEQCIHYLETLVKTGWVNDMINSGKTVDTPTLISVKSDIKKR